MTKDVDTPALTDLCLCGHDYGTHDGHAACGEAYSTRKDDRCPCPKFRPAGSAPAVPKETDDVTDQDREPGNVTLRAGFLRGLAMREGLDEYDRLMLRRASRSLRAFAAGLVCREPRRVDCLPCLRALPRRS